MCRPENGGKKLEKKRQLRSAPCTEGDWTARDTIIHCIQRAGRLAAQKQLLEYLAWKADYSLHFLWCGFQLHSSAKWHLPAEPECLWAGFTLHTVYRAPWREEHSTALMPEGPGSWWGIWGWGLSMFRSAGWLTWAISVLAVLSQRKTKKEGSSERQQRTPTLRDAHNTGPCLLELGMTDNNSNSLH